MPRLRTGLMQIAVLIVLASCTGVPDRITGYVPSDEALEAVVVGRDTRGTVETILGSPGAEGVLADRGWYYVRSTYEVGGVREPEEVDREVVAITFDEDGLVTNIERFGLEDGQVVALSRRVTDSNTQGIGFLRQTFGNLGRIQADQFIQ